MSDTATNDFDESIKNNEDPIAIVYHQIPVWLLSVWVVFPVLAIMVIVIAWIFVYTYRNKPIVAMSQPEFLYNICVGALLIASHMLFYLPVALSNNHDTDIKPLGLHVCCNLSLWSWYIGYILVDSALLCKIYRIKLITDQPLRRGLMILPKHVMGPYIAIILITVGIMIAWTAVHPDKFETMELDPNTNEKRGICSWDSYNTVDTVFANIMSGLIMIVEIILLVLLCKIRHVNQELGDSKRIFRLIFYEFIIHIITTLFFQTMILWKIQASLVISIQMLLHIIPPFLSSIGIVGFLIAPRIYYVWYEHKHGHLPENVQMIGGGRTTVRGVNPGDN